MTDVWCNRKDCVHNVPTNVHPSKHECCRLYIHLRRVEGTGNIFCNDYLRRKKKE